MFQRESMSSYIFNSHEVKDLSNGGECSQCGGCCSNSLHLTDKEILDIKRYVKVNNIQPSATVASVLTRVPSIDNICPFLDRSKTHEMCKIYPVRPYICKAFLCCNVSAMKLMENIEWVTDPTRRQVNVRDTFFPK